MQDADIKQAMQERYDGFGQQVARQVDAIQSPAELWRMAEGTTPALVYYRQRKLATALCLGGWSSGAAILDVGCATGDYTFLLSRRGFRMTGADLSPKSIETAAMKAERLSQPVRFLCEDAESLAALPDGAFDGVVSFSALRYVPNLSSAFAAIRRVLRPGGVAVLDFPNRYCPWFTVLKNKVGVETHIHDHQYSAGDVMRRFLAAGFRDVSTRRILFTPYQTPPWLLPAFKALDAVGERTPLNLMAAIVMGRGVKP